MCLDTITKQYEADSKEWRAWKILICDEGGVPVATPYAHKEVVCGAWLKASGNQIQTHEWGTVGYLARENVRQEYTSGFHVFADKNSADFALDYLARGSRKTWKLFPVKVRGVTCRGIDGTDDSPTWLAAKVKCLVAREMFIPKS